MLSRLIPFFILLGVMLFDIIAVFSPGWVSVAFRADGKLCHFPLRECTLAACATNAQRSSAFMGTQAFLQSDRCSKFQSALLVLAASFAYCLVFLIYMTGSYKPEQIKECCNANFSHCCVGTMKRWWFIIGVPLAHIVVGLLVLIQDNLPLKNFPGFLFYFNLVAAGVSVYAAYLLRIEQSFDDSYYSEYAAKFSGCEQAEGLARARMAKRGFHGAPPRGARGPVVRPTNPMGKGKGGGKGLRPPMRGAMGPPRAGRGPPPTFQPAPYSQNRGAKGKGPPVSLGRPPPGRGPARGPAPGRGPPMPMLPMRGKGGGPPRMGRRPGYP